MEKTPPAAPAPVINQELTKSTITLALSKEGLAYQEILQSAENVKFTRDNVGDKDDASVVTMAKVRSVKTKLEKMENPYTPAWKAWNEARKSLVDPIINVLSVKEGEFRKIVREIEEDRKRAEEENQRKQKIQTSINDFILTQSQAIAGAKTANELAVIEKLIGANKSATAKYQEFLQDFVKRCEELTPLIKDQKDAIRKLESLAKQEQAARDSGDDAKVIEIMDQREEVVARAEENKVVVQETAINQSMASSFSPSYVPPSAPKARRTTWKAEIQNVDEAIKKSKNMLDISLNAEKVRDSINTLKESGALKGKTELIVGGIRYFEDKIY